MHKNINNIFFTVPFAFIGMPGSGKTTIGKRIAAELDLKFIDSDQIIQDQTGQSIPNIFELHGENAFRKLEKDVILTILNEEKAPYVLSTGGGAPMTPEIQQALIEKTRLIYISATLDTLWERVQQGNESRPLLKGDDKKTKLEVLLSKRHATYSKAHIVVKSDDISEDQLVQNIKEDIIV